MTTDKGAREKEHSAYEIDALVAIGEYPARARVKYFHDMVCLVALMMA